MFHVSMPAERNTGDNPEFRPEPQEPVGATPPVPDPSTWAGFASIPRRMVGRAAPAN
jgi:hypothetical protein